VSEIFPHGFSSQLGIYEELYFGFKRIMVRWRANSELFARSVPLKHRSLLRHWKHNSVCFVFSYLYGNQRLETTHTLSQGSAPW
jgi:hypothetical protein